MSATTTRLPRSEAVALAWELVALLSPYCERIEVLGSIRRERDTIGDIELLAIPKVQAPVSRDLFGNPVPTSQLNQLHMRLDGMVIADGTLEFRQPRRWGDRYRAALYQGFPVDLFICLSPAQWGVLKVIRTGSAAFSKRLVTPVEQGGWCPSGRYFDNGQLWLITPSGLHMPLDTPEERQVFVAVGRDFVPPELREVP